MNTHIPGPALWERTVGDIAATSRAFCQVVCEFRSTLIARAGTPSCSASLANSAPWEIFP